MERAFKGVWIPKDIWLSEHLTLQEKVFLVEIDSLDNKDGCYASNKHFSKFFGLSKGRCSQIISQLQEKGFITISYRYNEDKSIDKRVMRVVNKLNTPIKFPKDPYLENDKESNTKSSNTSTIYTIFDYWNEKEIIKHRKPNQQMISHINARLEVYSVEELKKAIENYSFILNSNSHYWTHKWSLQDFMKPNNVTRFVDEADPLNNFKSNQKRKDKKELNINDFNLDD